MCVSLTGEVALTAAGQFSGRDHLQVWQQFSLRDAAGAKGWLIAQTSSRRRVCVCVSKQSVCGSIRNQPTTTAPDCMCAEIIHADECA